ncbi:MAG: ribonuclease HII [Paramuribaculum sp.]|nr:ribonuclease HII [Paramuribaculum sp.]
MTKSKIISHLPPCIVNGRNEAGCDEAGRGCLAGPVVAAAVILPDDFSHADINDSKQLTERQREELATMIKESAMDWAIGIVDNEEIDSINILRASILAMHRALDGLKMPPGAVAVDGNKFTPWKDIPWQTVVKGDGKFANIAAASILAKTHRDKLMKEFALKYPQYGWEINKGYPTKVHRAAIAQYGPTPLHRMSFRLLDNQLTLF